MINDLITNTKLRKYFYNEKNHEILLRDLKIYF